MGKVIEPNGDFIEEWINTRSEEGDLSECILDLINQNRRGAKIKETELLEALIAFSKLEDGSDVSDK